MFGWNAIEQHGKPFLKSFLEDVEKVEALDEHHLKVSFKTKGEMKPLIRAASILSPEPEHWWTTNDRDIGKTTLEPPLSSGPYKVKRSIPAARSPMNGWQLSGQGSAGQCRPEQFRHRTDRLLSRRRRHVRGVQERRVRLPAGEQGAALDIRLRHPPIREGRIEKRTLANERPFGAQGIRFNSATAPVQRPKVRLALAYLYDFEWLQKNILYGQYRRVKSNFPNSDLAPTAADRGPSGILEKYRGRVLERVFTTA